MEQITTSFSATEALKNGWEVFKANILKHIIVIIGASFISFLVSILTNPQLKTTLSAFASGNLEEISNLSGQPMASPNFLMMFVSFIIQILIGLFVYSYSVEAVKNPQAGINEIIGKYLTGKKILNYVLATIFISIIAMGLTFIFVPFAFLSGKLMGILLLIYFVFMIYVMIRVMFLTYFILENDDNAIDAIQHSWVYTKNKVGQLFLLILIFLGLSILSIFTLGLAFIIVIPLMYLTTAVAYYMIKGDWNKTKEVTEEVVS